VADKPRKNWFARAVDAVAETETNPLALAWRMLPPEARKAYASLPNAVAELSPGAAIRDTVQASGETGNALMQGRGWDAAGGVANMLTAAAGVIPGGRLITKGAKELAQPIRAYHGSPHSFDRFDMSKIGTGEGAQAYGHGLYFAENEGVARWYRDALTQNSHPTLLADNGTKIPATPRAWGGKIDYVDATRALSEAGNDYGQALAAASPRTAEILREFQQKGYSTIPAVNPGSMYEVNIHADPERFLDWNKPLSAQGKPVQEALQKFGYSDHSAQMQEFDNALLAALEGKGPMTLPKQPPNPLGANIYESSKLVPGNYRDKVAATRNLQEAGVAGIKYLDQGSRGAGEGSRNYVAFDDKMIEILRKYGLLPVAAGGAAVAANPLSVGEGETY